jgi:hypothetical protein
MPTFYGDLRRSRTPAVVSMRQCLHHVSGVRVVRDVSEDRLTIWEGRAEDVEVGVARDPAAEGAERRPASSNYGFKFD